MTRAAQGLEVVGWGDPAIGPELDDEALATLRERVGELEPAPHAG